MLPFQTAYHWLTEIEDSYLSAASSHLANQITSASDRFNRDKVSGWMKQLQEVATGCGKVEEIAEANVVCAFASYLINDLTSAISYLHAAEGLYGEHEHQVAVVKWLLGCIYWSKLSFHNGHLAMIAWQESITIFEHLKERDQSVYRTDARWYAVRVEEMRKALNEKIEATEVRKALSDPTPADQDEPLDASPDEYAYSFRKAPPVEIPPELQTMDGARVSVSEGSFPGISISISNPVTNVVTSPVSNSLLNSNSNPLLERMVSPMPYAQEKEEEWETPISGTNKPAKPEIVEMDQLEEYENLFKFRMEAFEVVDMVQAGSLVGIGSDMNPIGHIEIDRVLIDGRTYKIVPLRNNGRVLSLTKYLNTGCRLTSLKVRGDSMNKANIHEGDYVLVLLQNTAKNNDIVIAGVAELENIAEGTVKRYRHRGDKIWLVPESTNPEHIALPFTHDNEDFTIYGVVMAVFKPVNEPGDQPPGGE